MARTSTQAAMEHKLPSCHVYIINGTSCSVRGVLLRACSALLAGFARVMCFDSHANRALALL